MNKQRKTNTNSRTHFGNYTKRKKYLCQIYLTDAGKQWKGANYPSSSETVKNRNSEILNRLY